MQTQRSAGLAPARPSLPATPSSPSLPKHLTMRFTNASDTNNVVELFNSERKKSMDPNSKIRKRNQDELATSIETGSAVIALDEQEEIRFFGMASEHFSFGQDHPEAIIELGAIMSDIGGYGVAQLGSAMLALKEANRLRMEFPFLYTSGVHALVAKDNLPAQKVFTRDLGWSGISSDQDCSRLFRTQGKYTNNPDAQQSRLWLEFGHKASEKAANIVVGALSKQRLTSRRAPSSSIPIDLDHHVFKYI